MSDLYLIALGSNRRHHIHGAPGSTLRAAMEELAALGTVRKRSPIMSSAPMGSALRRFANAACAIESERDPLELLRGLKRIESDFGRRPGRRWGDRVLDLDIVLWSGGTFRAPSLTIPHPAFRARHFVLRPAVQVAPDWRDPTTGRTVRQLDARLTAARPLPR
ncbi:2-amino-4-hydroxy-6-hydroxymethyldihydropteridine diphosphokinase [Erythrobacter sp.]|uniref:2-amino-4-hydroxy-6- hydroxymethyldihydropteridine diphosphokinase n=1 Tax=Erythrobacter sp. TaxID=1042 RepID=UPI003C7494FB